MAYGISEFPSTNVYDSDLAEMICLYKEMKNKYEEVLSRMEDLENKWETIDDKIDKAIIEGVENATRQIIAEVNSIIADSEKRINDIANGLNADMSDLRKYVNDTAKALNESMIEINNALDNALEQFDALSKEVDRKIADEIAKYDTDINNKIENITDGMWQAIQDLNIKLEDITKEYPPVKNPITGLIQPLDAVLDAIWYWANMYGITAKEFDALGLTAGEFDDMNLTAEQFDFAARWYLIEQRKRLVVSPSTGKLVDIGQAIYDVDRHYAINSITAGLFDTLDITAGDFDALGLTAEEFDYWAAYYLTRMALINIAYEIAPKMYRFTKTVTINPIEETQINIQTLKAVNSYSDAFIDHIIEGTTYYSYNGKTWEVPLITTDGENGSIIVLGGNEIVNYFSNALNAPIAESGSQYTVTIDFKFLERGTM